MDYSSQLNTLISIISLTTRYVITILFVSVKMSASVRVTQEKFGVIDGQTEVTKYRLVNSNGAELHLITFGAAIQQLIVPDRNGKLDDITLGFADIDGTLVVLRHSPFTYQWLITLKDTWA
jgi:hypothetical protein